MGCTIHNNLDGILEFADLGAAITGQIEFEDGNFTLSGGIQEFLNTVNPYQSRGRLSGLRHGERIFPTFSFSAKVSSFTSASQTVLPDIASRTGKFAGAVNTFTCGDVLTYDMTLIVVKRGDETVDQTTVFADVHISIDYAEGDPSVFTCNGVVYGEISGAMTASQLPAAAATP